MAFIVISALLLIGCALISEYGIFHKLIALILDIAISIGEALFAYGLFNEIIVYFESGKLTSALTALIDVVIGIPVCAIIMFVRLLIMTFVSVGE